MSAIIKYNPLTYIIFFSMFLFTYHKVRAHTNLLQNIHTVSLLIPSNATYSISNIIFFVSDE